MKQRVAFSEEEEVSPDAPCRSHLLSQERVLASPPTPGEKCWGQHPEMVTGERGMLKRTGALLGRKKERQAMILALVITLTLF